MTPIEAARTSTASTHAGPEPRASALWWCLPTLLFWGALVWWAMK